MQSLGPIISYFEEDLVDLESLHLYFSVLALSEQRVYYFASAFIKGVVRCKIANKFTVAILYL